MSTTVARAYERLSFLTALEYRGRGDTWSAALDRKARKIGIPPVYAKRIWDRWQSMKDVSGNVLDAIYAAYEAECEKHERAADESKARREARHSGQAIGEGRFETRLGSDEGLVRREVHAAADRRGRASSHARADVGTGG